MAIKKAIEINSTGTMVEYWKIKRVIWDCIEGDCTVHLSGYLNNKARQDGKRPVISEELYIPEGLSVTDMDKQQINFVKFAYNKIKEKAQTIITDKDGKEQLTKFNIWKDSEDI